MTALGHTTTGGRVPMTADAVAGRFFAAIEAGDIDTLRDIYAQDVEIWHNDDGLIQTRDENLRTLGWIMHNLTGLRYIDVRRQATPNGFVQEHVLRVTNRAGEVVTVPACIVATVVDGQITRLNEYLDSAPVARIADK